MRRFTRRFAAYLLAAAPVFTTACMPDSELAAREHTTKRLRAESRSRLRDLERIEAYRDRLARAVRAGATVGERTSLADELRRCGLSVVPGEKGTLRLLPSETDALALSRLERAARVLRRRLPDHELSVESRDIERAVRAVRVLHERAGVPGESLRACFAKDTPGLVVEVRPTRMESLEEVLAAAME